MATVIELIRYRCFNRVKALRVWWAHCYRRKGDPTHKWGCGVPILIWSVAFLLAHYLYLLYRKERVRCFRRFPSFSSDAEAVFDLFCFFFLVRHPSYFLPFLVFSSDTEVALDNFWFYRQKPKVVFDHFWFCHQKPKVFLTICGFIIRNPKLFLTTSDFLIRNRSCFRPFLIYRQKPKVILDHFWFSHVKPKEAGYDRWSANWLQAWSPKSPQPGTTT